MIIKAKHYIGGDWVGSAGGLPFEVVDPSTEEAFAMIALGTKADVDRAVAAAKAAFPAWVATAPAERLAMVEKLLAVYKRRAADMAQAISSEMGAPIDMALERQVSAGTYHITNYMTAFRSFRFGAPFGGVKRSGCAREGGVWGIEEYLEVKAVSGWHDE